MKRLFHSSTLTVAASAWLVFSIGCGRDGVKVYHVDNSDTTTPSPTATAMNPMPATMPAGQPAPDNSGLPALKYALPAGWTEKKPTQMRVASFEISESGKQADVSVIPLGGMAGGDFANVNRWRGQVNLPPLADDELQKIAEKITVAGQPADLYDIAGTNPDSNNSERILACILHRDATAWFFKVTGESGLVEKNKAAFIGFLKSVEFGGPAAPAEMDMSQLPASHPAIPGMNPASIPMMAPDVASQPTWTVPAGWQAGPLEQFLVAKFIIAGDGDAKAEVNVSSLAGDGGGLLANINRWRAQLGQSPVTEADLSKLPTIDASGETATEVKISGTNPRTGKPAELVGIVLPLGGQTWFYKLMGDAGVVTAQKDALIKFVQSAKYP